MDQVSSFLLSVIESSSDAIIGLKIDGTVISWNPGAERIYERPADDMVGTSILRISLPDHIGETKLILERIFNGERVRHFQTTHLKHGGVPIPVSVSISPVFDSFENVVGASFIARDLSPQFSFEKTLRETEQRYQKLKSSLELAHHIQETLLPSVTDLTCELDVYVKTFYSEDIGGDYYDFFSAQASPEHIFGLAVGDVSGHGTGAALLMAMAKGVLQTEVEHSDFDLTALIARLNRFFCRYAEPSRLMTLFLAVIDARSRHLSWCSAGQGPVYVYHPEDQWYQELRCTGPPLGVVDDENFESQSLILRDGDIVIVGTDGLWEARNRKGEMFSIERVRQFLATWHRKTAEEICTGLLTRVKRFTGQDHLEDDTSLMIVKIPPRSRIQG